MRHSAWLNTAPESHGKEQRISRLKKLQIDRNDDLYRPDMPPHDAPHLVGYLWEIGPTMATGMSAWPITHEEIRAWQENTGIELHQWESRFIRRLSCEYLSESNRAEKIDCPPPWHPEELSLEDRKLISDKIRESMRSLISVQQRKPC